MTRLLLFIAFFTTLNLYSQDNFEVVGQLPSEVFETSGLLFLGGKLITHNDSGNEPVLYEIDTTSLSITRTVTLDNVPNTDWEDLAQDDNYIYIADFGNNVGSRTDLAVYRISKTEYAAQDQVSAEVISFNYVDQTDFSGTQNSDFDAEALIIYKDQLIIFTKQWQTNGTVAYSIPNVPGSHVAESFDNFSSDGLITGATYDSNADVLFLSGYSQQLQPFVIRIEEIATELSFNATTTKINLPVGFAQIEGITSVGNRYFLSSERFTNANPPVTLESTLYAFNFGSDSNPDPPPDPEPEPGPEPTPEPEEPYREGVILYKPQGSLILSYDLFGDRQLFARAVFDTSGRLIQYTRIQDIESNEIDYSVFGSGVYYLTFYLRGLTLSEPFIIE